ncbi:tetratricopeptide repeat protein [Ignavibacterium sp.]|jgi:tetratricopeptide (TPR) repeat protein|uniref:tetratricopeptide repeat protein n=1 Tax=Ignavibacterium sp. TaxID=2651167 RepID=UPI0025C5CFE1|nr:tetratricopeptide repeat protein [Ignavibacterium sp.]
MIDKEKEHLALEYFEKAYRLHIGGKIQEAIKAYRKSLQYYPTAKTHTYLGWALSLEKKFEEAIEECKIAIELDPDYGNPYNDIGTYLLALNKYDDAVYWFQNALDAKDYSTRYIPYYHLGKIYELRGSYFTALKYYSDSLELNPEFEPAKTAYYKLIAMMN